MANYIFDFDGTIANSMFVIKDVANEILRDMGKQPVSDEDFEAFRGLSVGEGLKVLNISKLKVPRLLFKGQSKMAERIDEVKIHKDMDVVLKELSNSGNRLGIVTSNDKDSVRTWLEREKLASLFEFVEGGSFIFGKSSMLKKVIKRNNYLKSETYYVGDVIRDVEAAKKVGIKSIAVDWGANNKERLLKSQPDYLVSEAKQIIELGAQQSKV